MRFAKVVFYIAGIWGLLAITPLFFLKKAVEAQAPAAALTHPEFYYGFAVVTLMWQVAFFIIARDPARYRALMIPPALAKFGYAAVVLILYRNGEPIASQLPFAAADFLLAVLFVAAFFRTKTGIQNRHMRIE